MTAVTSSPGQAVYEAHQAFMIRCFPGIAEIRWGELSEEAQAEWEGIARAGVAAYIEANGADPVDARAVIAEVVEADMAPRFAAVVAEREALRLKLTARDEAFGKLADDLDAEGRGEVNSADTGHAARFERAMSHGLALQSAASRMRTLLGVS
jgi:hypothetical protein